MMPVPSVAGQTRGLDAVDGPNLAGTDQSDQPLEARALAATRAGASQIIVDYGDRARSYCRRWLSRLPMTWAMVDWRT
jgi:hypothetical protein